MPTINTEPRPENTKIAAGVSNMCILQYDGPQWLYSYNLYLRGLVASNPLDLQVIKGVFHLKNTAQDYNSVNKKKKQ